MVRSKQGKRGAEMEKKEIVERCPYVKKCGACHIGEKSYEEELAEKKKWESIAAK